MKPKLIIFESHPVQYRAPVYRELERLCPREFEVIYGTDFSAKGWVDRGFGQQVCWDLPLMEGYPCRALNNLRSSSLGGFASLSGADVVSVLKASPARTVLLTQYLYRYDLTALVGALRLRRRVWIRQETQDEAFVRSPLKQWARSFLYRWLYAPVDHAFYFGAKNRRHLLAHGLQERQLTRAPYATVNALAQLPEEVLQQRRVAARERLGMAADEWVVGFSGKFIEKKDPLLLLEAVALMAKRVNRRLGLLMIGSGVLEAEIRRRGRVLESAGVHLVLPGFVNQSALPDHYLAMDALVLPSRRLGETWGLVVNEALQAGCAVVMSEAVGCSEEFGGWERVRVIPQQDPAACAEALLDLSQYPREVSWCREAMQDYSIEAAARGLALRLQELT
jgi:glycosyltransferase involved in cell wall biosynthesis